MKMDRRRFMQWLGSASAASIVMPAMASGQSPEAISDEVLTQAASVLGLEFTPSERELMLQGVKDQLENYKGLRALNIGNEVAPAIHFSPLLENQSPPKAPRRKPKNKPTKPTLRTAPREEKLAFLPLTELGGLLRRGVVTSTQLTRMYLLRLKRHDATLKCVVNLTEQRALNQARQADEELRRGVDRGPLHGIPWGAKDLLTARGAPTTWGAATHKNQVLQEEATVVKKLDEAGAVLVAKLSVGALAWGDVWFGGVTKNPWNPEQGSSGSSAGPASAVVAGLVGFAIGTETLGSIISPSQRCGATGLRPTFGRVSRHGCMALSWTMDKIGPICRNVEDAALVFDAIHGSDGRDEAVIDAPFTWDASKGIEGLRIGYDRASFEGENPDKPFEQQALKTLRRMGAKLVPVTLPEMNAGNLLIILTAEAAAAFDDLTRSNRDDELTRQVAQAWPNVFRTARLIPAVEYIQANRARRLLMKQFAAAIAEVDVFVHSTYGSSSLVMANLTGQPAIVVPNGFRSDGTPASISFTGQLFGEQLLLNVAKAFQEKTPNFNRRPPRYLS